ncbi:MAG: hypothetical protein OXR62_13335 [Ahrensia sp.]|nr:hypothetical protein [Ahrensia sp.]
MKPRLLQLKPLESLASSGALAQYAWAVVALASVSLMALGLFSSTDNHMSPQPVDREHSAQSRQAEVHSLIDHFQRQAVQTDPQTTASTSDRIQSPNALTSPSSDQSYPGANPLGAAIAASDSVPELRGQLAALRKRAPDLFSNLAPLVSLHEVNGRLEARLIAGPFDDADDLSRFCRSMRLQLTMDCAKSAYSGSPL